MAHHPLQIDIVVTGLPKSGKKCFLNQVLRAQTNPQQPLNPRVSVQTQLSKHTVIWDFLVQSQPTETKQHLAYYCVDLSREINIEMLQTDLHTFHEAHPATPIILVGTKADLCPDSAASMATLKNSLLNLPFLFKDVHITSAHQPNEVLRQQLEDQLHHISQRILQQAILVEQLLLTFKRAMQSLSKQKQKKILEQLNNLQQILTHHSIYQQLTAIDNFTQNCGQIIQGDHAALKHLLHCLISIAVLAFLGSGVGIGIGFLVGLWSTPSAFLVSLAAAQTSTLMTVGASTGIGGCLGSLWGAHAFFQSKEVHQAAKAYSGELKKERQLSIP